MAKRRVIWSRNATNQLHQILDYFKERNKNSFYSRKLNFKTRNQLDIVAQTPEIGKMTKFEDIRGLIVGNYILFYEILTDEISVLKVWDSREDPEKMDADL